MQPLDLAKFLEDHATATCEPPAPPANPPAAREPAADPRAAYAQAALDDEAAIVANCTHERNNQLNASAFSLFQLVAAGELDEATVTARMADAARACGLDEREIGPTIGSARRKGLAEPRDLSGVGTAPATPSWDEVMGGMPGVPPAAAPPAPLALDAADLDTHTACPPGQEDNPHRLARLYLDGMRHPDGLLVRYWQEHFYVWDGASYRIMPTKELHAELNSCIAHEFDRLHNIAAMAYGMAKARGGDGEGNARAAKMPRPIPVTTQLVANVTQALAGMTLLRADRFPNQPAWIAPDPAASWPVNEVLPARNALIHLPSFVEKKPATRPPTPKFFSPYALDYDFEDSAPDPVTWLEFLGARPLRPDSPIKIQLWPDDPTSIETLQEFMGYLLTHDKSQQKILLMIGPKRSGKGTIAKVIRELVGRSNVANPRLSMLATNFGVTTLIGKSVAIIDDARVSNRTDTAAVTEQLLTISGDAPQTIDRKYRESVTVDLPTRFVINSNEIPKLKDDSGALASRFLILQTTRTAIDQEDTRLEFRLYPELPGILLWAIEGWARLRRNGRFTQPVSSDSLRRLMDGLTTPVKEFLDECCLVGPDFECPISTLFNLWKTWNQARGADYKGNEANFSRSLHSAVPGLKTGRKQQHGDRFRYFHGLAPRPNVDPMAPVDDDSSRPLPGESRPLAAIDAGESWGGWSSERDDEADGDWSDRY